MWRRWRLPWRRVCKLTLWCPRHLLPLLPLSLRLGLLHHSLLLRLHVHVHHLLLHMHCVCMHHLHLHLLWVTLLPL